MAKVRIRNRCCLPGVCLIRTIPCYRSFHVFLLRFMNSALINVRLNLSNAAQHIRNEYELSLVLVNICLTHIFFPPGDYLFRKDRRLSWWCRSSRSRSHSGFSSLLQNVLHTLPPSVQNKKNYSPKPARGRMAPKKPKKKHSNKNIARLSSSHPWYGNL